MSPESSDVQAVQEPAQGAPAGAAGSAPQGLSADAQGYLDSLARAAAADAGDADLSSNLSATAGPPVVAAVPAWAPALPQLGEVDPWEAQRTLTDAEQWAAADAPAARPEDYVMPHTHEAQRENIGEESFAEARGLQSLLWHAGMPATEGSALLHTIAEAGRRGVTTMNDVDFELHMRNTQHQLRKVMGDTEFDRCQAALGKLRQDMAAKLPAAQREAFEDYLEDHAHVLAQPMVLHKLLTHAGRGRKR